MEYIGLKAYWLFSKGGIRLGDKIRYGGFDWQVMSIGHNQCGWYFSAVILMDDIPPCNNEEPVYFKCAPIASRINTNALQWWYGNWRPCLVMEGLQGADGIAAHSW